MVKRSMEDKVLMVARNIVALEIDIKEGFTL